MARILLFIYIARGGLKMTYEAVVKKGHTGAGSFNESKIFINASSILEAMCIAKGRGWVKKGRGYNSAQSVLSIKVVEPGLINN